MGASRPVEIYLIELAAFNANPIKNSHYTVVTETYLSNFAGNFNLILMACNFL